MGPRSSAVAGARHVCRPHQGRDETSAVTLDRLGPAPSTIPVTEESPEKEDRSLAGTARTRAMRDPQRQRTTTTPRMVTAT